MSLAVILGIAECHESDYIYDGSGSGQQIPLFPSELLVVLYSCVYFARCTRTQYLHTVVETASKCMVDMLLSFALCDSL